MRLGAARVPTDQPKPQESPDRFAPNATTASGDPLEVGGPIPASIGRTADLYSDVRALRLTMEKEVEKVKARESELREYIIANLSKSDDTGAAGLRYRAQIVIKDVPRAMDWPKVHAFIQETGRFDLLQKRLVFADELTSTSRVQILNLRLATLQVIALSHIEGWLRSAAESLDSISNDIAGIRDVLDKESN
jgi:hypothetical protein